MNYLGIFIAIILMNNYVLDRSLGINSFVSGSRFVKSSFYQGIGLTIVLVVGTLAIYPICNYVLNQFDLFYIDMLVITFLSVVLLSVFMKLVSKYVKTVHYKFGAYLPSMVYNSAFFGVMFSLDTHYIISYTHAIIYALGCGLGYTLALVLFSMIKKHINEDKVPEPFRGLPISLIVAGFISIIFQFIGGTLSHFI